MGKKLYVGNLPFATGEVELQALFAEAGTVDSAKVVRDGQTGHEEKDGERPSHTLVEARVRARPCANQRSQ